ESNCKQDNNVYTACKELFFSHELNETEKLWLVVALSKARPDEFEVKLRSGKNSGLEIVKPPTPTATDAAAPGCRNSGKPIPDSENSQSKNGFGAQLFFTEDQKFFDDWNKPETPQLNKTNKARRNIPIYTVLVFSNPGLADSETADVSCDITVCKPDGS